MLSLHARLLALMSAAVLAIPAHAQASSSAERFGPVSGDSAEKDFLIKADPRGLRVFLRHLASTSKVWRRHPRGVVLMVHGSTFPSALAFAFRSDGVSWMDDLAKRGFDVWAFDFIGYGKSDRYPEMYQPPFANSPLGRAPAAELQIAAVTRFIASHAHVARVSIIAHSWGTIPTGLFAGLHPELVDRLVLFGPVAQRDRARDSTRIAAYQFVTENDQRTRFRGYVPVGNAQVLPPDYFAAWGPAYMATDSMSRTRTPPSVEVPSGPDADIDDAWSGHLGYDPSKITAPVLIIRGNWDVVTKDADARWLFDALTSSPVRRDIKISRATHVMHLEEGRHQLFSEAAAFLAEPTDAAAVRAGQKSMRTGTTRSITIAGFGALSGPARSFGINSRAALEAAADSVNRAGGVHLADGAIGHLDVSYVDDHCNPADGIAIVRHIAASDALVSVGPSCSGVAEPLYEALQRTVADTGDHGIEVPVFTDGATKAGLARISEWAFRNTPNETDMYRALWIWVRRHYPGAQTVYGGQEADFAHSHSTWQNIIAPEARAAGLTLLGHADWSITDTTFDKQVAEIKAAGADVVVLSAHAATTCGVVRETARQGVHPRVLVGLTSASTSETLTTCGAEAEGLLIPTTFAPVNAAALAAARAVRRKGGIADLHSMAAWEIVMTIVQVIEREGITAKPDSVAIDRLKFQAGLARLTSVPGLLGTIQRGADREARKPFVLVQARKGKWRVVYTP